MKKNSFIKWVQQEYGMSIKEVFRYLYLEENLSVKELAARLFLTKSIAHRWLKKFGIKTKKS